MSTPLSAMKEKKMKTTKTTLMFGLTSLCAALLAGWVATRSHAAADAIATRQVPDDELQRLLTARFDSATKALRSERAKLDRDKATFETVYQAAQRVLDAELALSATTDQRVTALTKHVALMRQFSSLSPQNRSPRNPPTPSKSSRR